MKQKINDRIGFIFLSLFSFIGFFPNKIKGIPVILLFIFSIYQHLKYRNKKYDYRIVIVLTSLYTILMPGCFYSNNLQGIDKHLSTRLSLLVLPLAFFFLNQTKSKFSIHKLLNLIVYGGIGYSLVIIAYFQKIGFFSNIINYNEAISFSTSLMYGINQHPIYSSIFLVIPLIILTIKIIKSKKNIISVFFYFVKIIPILFTLAILARKSIIISVLISVCFLIFFNVKTKKNIMLILFSFFVGFVFLYKFSHLESRFKEMFQKNTYEKIDFKNSTSIRFAIYRCTLERIKESPLLGYGLGDSQQQLNSCYLDNNYKLMYNGSYNSHNQYLSYYLSSGILGFSVIVLFVVFIFIDSLRKNNVYLATVILFFGAMMLFENILERQSGVIFFSFFISLFYYNNPNKPEEIHEK